MWRDCERFTRSNFTDNADVISMAARASLGTVYSALDPRQCDCNVLELGHRSKCTDSEWGW